MKPLREKFLLCWSYDTAGALLTRMGVWKGIFTWGWLAVCLGVVHMEARGQVGVNLSPLPFTCLPDLVYTLVSLSFSDFPFENGNNVYPVGSF